MGVPCPPAGTPRKHRTTTCPPPAQYDLYCHDTDSFVIGFSAVRQVGIPAGQAGIDAARRDYEDSFRLMQISKAL